MLSGISLGDLAVAVVIVTDRRNMAAGHVDLVRLDGVVEHDCECARGAVYGLNAVELEGDSAGGVLRLELILIDDSELDAGVIAFAVLLIFNVGSAVGVDVISQLGALGVADTNCRKAEDLHHSASLVRGQGDIKVDVEAGFHIDRIYVGEVEHAVLLLQNDIGIHGDRHSVLGHGEFGGRFGDNGHALSLDVSVSEENDELIILDIVEIGEHKEALTRGTACYRLLAEIILGVGGNDAVVSGDPV